jgi:uncharacterized protein (TIGR03067 family)
MTRKLLAVGSLLCLLALTSQAADDKKADKDKLQGTWVATSITVGDKSIDVPKEKQATFTFKGDKMTVHDPEKNKDEEGTFKIDEKKKEIDLTGPSEKDPKVLETMMGVYSLDGDTLKLGISNKGPKGDRPKGFDDKECVVMVFKRMTK